MVPMLDPAIMVTRRWPESVEARLRERYDHVTFNEADEPLGPEELLEALRSFDVLLPNVSDRLTAEMLLSSDVKTKLIGNYGVGYSNIDIEAAAEAGIVVTNTPGVLTDATADLAMTLLLMTARRAGEGERHVRSGRWTGWRPTHMMGGDVTGKTLGVLGMGRIGAALAKRCHFGFDMPVVWFDSFDGDLDPGIPGAMRMKSIEEVLGAADYVSLHMPGGGGNSHLIGTDELNAMKRSAFLINTARGDVVDQGALALALSAGVIAGAGLDVFEDEPRVPQELTCLENVVLLPHLGSATVEARTAMGMLVLDNLADFLNGAEPRCRVA